MPSVTRRAGGSRGHREAAQLQVLEAVERLLAAGESFTALGVQRIAAEAGIARTTFYGHFPDKTTLLMRLTESATTELFAHALAWIEDDAGTLESHTATVLALIREHRKHAPLLRALAEVAAYDPEVEAFWRGRIESFAEVLAIRLERDRAAGRVAPDLDVETTAFWIAWATERSIAMHVGGRPAEADAAFAAGITRATFATMRRTDF